MWFQNAKLGKEESRYSMRSHHAQYDEEIESLNSMMQETLEHVVRSAYGVIYVLVGGLEGEPLECWDQAFVISSPSEALSRLTDSDRSDYLAAEEMIPGVGLLGALWNEVSWEDATSNSSVPQFSSRRLLRGISSNTNSGGDASASSAFDVRGTMREPYKPAKNHFSRDVIALAADPDQAYDPHLQLLVEAGIGIAIAVPYNINGHRGVAVFGARPTANRAKLHSPSNHALLSNASSMIGSLIAFRRSYSISRAERIEECEQACHRVVTYFKQALAFSYMSENDDLEAAASNLKNKKETKLPIGFNFSVFSSKKPSEIMSSINEYQSRVFSPWLRKYCRKCFGAGSTPPPVLPWRPSLFCCLGTFISILPWSILNEYIIYSSNGELSLTRGSYGSLVAAQYLLFASPAAQPWNAFGSELICGIVALSINYIPGFPIWLRTAFTPSLIVLIMGKTGMIHPTAGGDALLYAHDGATWTKYGFILFNYIFGIVMAILINNLSVDRQYPNYWGWIFKKIKEWCSKKTPEEEDEKDL